MEAIVLAYVLIFIIYSVFQLIVGLWLMSAIPATCNAQSLRAYTRAMIVTAVIGLGVYGTWLACEQYCPKETKMEAYTMRLIIVFALALTISNWAILWGQSGRIDECPDMAGKDNIKQLVGALTVTNLLPFMYSVFFMYRTFSKGYLEKRGDDDVKAAAYDKEAAQKAAKAAQKTMEERQALQEQVLAVEEARKKTREAELKTEILQDEIRKLAESKNDPAKEEALRKQVRRQVLQTRVEAIKKQQLAQKQSRKQQKEDELLEQKATSENNSDFDSDIDSDDEDNIGFQRLFRR